MKNEPLRTVLLPIVLAAAAASIQAFATGADTRGIIAAALGALVLAGQEYARSKVTPVKAPYTIRTDAGYGAIELLVGLVVFVILVLVLLKLIAAL